MLEEYQAELEDELAEARKDMEELRGSAGKEQAGAAAGARPLVIELVEMSLRSAKKWPGGWPHRLSEVFYGPVFRLIATTGIGPSFIVILETRGRRSGRTHSTVHISAEHAGDNYLAAAVDYSDWLLNARASGGQANVRHGKRKAVKLEEISVDQRAPILRSYLKRSLGARLVFKLSPSSPIDKFQEVAPKHPVFKIVEV